LPIIGLCQETGEIRGSVIDSYTRNIIVGANIYTEDTEHGTITDIDGNFSIKLPYGTHTIFASYMGYGKKEIKLEVPSDKQLVIKLKPQNFRTSEVVVSSESADRNVSQVEAGKLSLRTQDIKELPSFLGEADPIKVLSTTAGVAQSEGNGGLAVRGNGNDQNLVLLDNALIYNASHLLGIYSVFNADAIQELNFTKSGIPAQYGGRLSSVIDISTQGGTYNRTEIKGNIGLLSSNLTFKSPIIKDKLWMSISGRRTYLEYLIAPISSRFETKEGKENETTYYFGDLNAKLEWQFSPKDRLCLFMYMGKDHFVFDNQRNAFLTIDWGNTATGFKWRHNFSKKAQLNLSQNVSMYDFFFDAHQEYFNLQLNTEVLNTKHNTDITIKQAKGSATSFGIEHIYYKLRPNDVSLYIKDDAFDFGEAQTMFAHEASVYVSQKLSFGDQLSAEAGIRGTAFFHIGPYLQKNNLKTGADSTTFQKGETVAQYFSVDPRLSVRYMLNDETSVKASYTITHQNLHHTSLSSASLPADVWLPATEGIEPMTMHHVSAGYFRNFNDNLFETSVNLYYKYLFDVADMKDGLSSLNKTVNISENMEFGNADAYGIELSIKKTKGRLKGGIAYTLSSSQFYIKNSYGSEQYNSDYHRPHDLSVSASYQLSPKIELSSLFTLASGKPITLPDSRYFIAGNIMNVYSQKNGYSMPAYHRLDASMKIALSKEEKRLQSDLIISIYNLYNHQNPFFIYFDPQGNLNDFEINVKTKQVSLFTVLPSISWQFKF